jgi:hypothetical protein
MQAASVDLQRSNPGFGPSHDRVLISTIGTDRTYERVDNFLGARPDRLGEARRVGLSRSGRERSER